MTISTNFQAAQGKICKANANANASIHPMQASHFGSDGRYHRHVCFLIIIVASFSFFLIHPSLTFSAFRLSSFSSFPSIDLTFKIHHRLSSLSPSRSSSHCLFSPPSPISAPPLPSRLSLFLTGWTITGSFRQISSTHLI